MFYRWHVGTVAWVLHRLSGALIVFYLVLHIWVMSFLQKGPESFNRVMHLLENPLFKLLEIGLLGVVIYHSLNGIRLVILDLGYGMAHQKKMFWAVVVVGIAIFILGAVPLYPF